MLFANMKYINNVITNNINQKRRGNRLFGLQSWSTIELNTPIKFAKK